MGNLKDHIHRKRKERKRKRDRKDKFKVRQEKDGLKSIERNLRKKLVIGEIASTSKRKASVPDSDSVGDSDRCELGNFETSTNDNSLKKRYLAELRALNRLGKKPLEPADGKNKRKRPELGFTTDSARKKHSVSRESHSQDEDNTENKRNKRWKKLKAAMKEKKRLRQKPAPEVLSEDFDADSESTNRVVQSSLSDELSDIGVSSTEISRIQEDLVENHSTASFVSGTGNKALQKMRVAQFRIINELLYTSKSETAEKLFKDDEKNFDVYHEGYRLQVNKWLLNPVDRIISHITESYPRNTRIADLGCGEAKLAACLKPLGYTVHSFDLVAANEHVQACNIRNVPLASETVDLAVMCLSLMGTDMGQFVLEANRILKAGGKLLVAEVESRIPSVDAFVKVLKRYGFALETKDTARNIFHFFDFRKAKAMPKGAEKNMDNVLWLKPCLYKKR